MKRIALGLALASGALPACSEGSRPALPAGRDAGRATQRVIEPPQGTVRPLPPYAIGAGGVGPYRLGATASEIASLLSVPRVAILGIPGVVDASVVRAEDDAILIGGARAEKTSFSKATFIAVLTKEIGGTDGGVTVGARQADLDTLGPPSLDPALARDPDIDVRAAMPGAWFLMRDGAVRAILLHATAAPVPAEGAAVRDAGLAPAPVAAAGGDAGVPPMACGAGAPPPVAEVAALAQLGAPRRAVIGCFDGSPQVLVTGADALAIVELDDPRPRRLAGAELPGLAWAAALRAEPGRDEIVAVVEKLTADELTVGLVVLRLDGGKLTRVAEDTVYRVSRNEGQWIGASLSDLQLLVVVEARGERYVVSGALVHGGPGRIREVAPLSQVEVQRRRRGGGEPTPGGAPAPAGEPAPRDAGPAGSERAVQRDAAGDRHDAGAAQP